MGNVRQEYFETAPWPIGGEGPIAPTTAVGVDLSAHR